jgi:hypothetical protein
MQPVIVIKVSTDAWYTTIVSRVDQLFWPRPSCFILIVSLSTNTDLGLSSIYLPFVVQTLNATSLFDSIFQAIKSKAAVIC